ACGRNIAADFIWSIVPENVVGQACACFQLAPNAGSAVAGGDIADERAVCDGGGAAEHIEHSAAFVGGVGGEGTVGERGERVVAVQDSAAPALSLAEGYVAVEPAADDQRRFALVVQSAATDFAAIAVERAVADGCSAEIVAHATADRERAAAGDVVNEQ